MISCKNILKDQINHIIESYSNVASPYLGILKHPEVCVHVHSPGLVACLFVQLGGLPEFTLIGINVSQEHLGVRLPAPLTLLRELLIKGLQCIQIIDDNP